MREKRHRRSRMIGTSVAVVTALALGGGGLAIVSDDASAHWAGWGSDSATQSPTPTPTPQATVQQAGQGGSTTIDCPDVGQELSKVPREARAEVNKKLAQLDTEVAEAYNRLALNRQKAQSTTWVKNSVLRPLNSERRRIIIRIEIIIEDAGAQPTGLDEMASCDAKQGEAPAAQSPSPVASQSAPASQPPAGGAGDVQPPPPVAGPAKSDFVDITKVQPNVKSPRRVSGASTGTFRTRCGRNENGVFNSDNVIVAPGVSNGAHHFHDYVGNQENDAFATNDSLAAADTSCTNGDRSSHFWPVLRLQNGEQEADANKPGGGIEGNVGKILTPASVSLKFKGSPVGKVTAMPRFLRIITGDAKSFTNGPANANASWSCTGFENRQLKDKYPLCPEGSRVVRTFKFQSCWDGQNIDSANHRTHVAFADANGRCAEGFKAIPQLVQRITYNVPQGSVFAVDSFPEQLHKPVTDHGDFINVMSDRLMSKAVSCINGGRKCG